MHARCSPLSDLSETFSTCSYLSTTSYNVCFKCQCKQTWRSKAPLLSRHPGYHANQLDKPALRCRYLRAPPDRRFRVYLPPSKLRIPVCLGYHIDNQLPCTLVPSSHAV